ncbi:Vacuolar protein sorting-associated protein 51 homolog [Durusdinium trenchii]|uniref:Vacuolar protein sorting-associated protein 51 homolog n=1 Tax=Durusdinium trenchii TaxID=1381693 RepID=A0ABP0SNJ1_9DINO
MFVNAGHSAHILSAAGYALLNWFQGLVAAILPAHERAKNGCAYGMMQKTFAPQARRETEFCAVWIAHPEMSSYDNVDYYKEYYGVIIVRTLLFLVGLIWMQHLMVRRVLAVETTSRRYLGGKRPWLRPLW